MLKIEKKKKNKMEGQMSKNLIFFKMGSLLVDNKN